ncbi:hypothetical protein [Gimesia panareensis]|uniref:hypothetical protein n=1 Tax=Gimesia panareensis TaxID=2527978 RepID=UPI0018D5BE26|nr:hypothetical protein [Gimesia panareensis]
MAIRTKSCVFPGLVLAASGATMVMIYKPVDKAHAPAPTAEQQAAEPAVNDAGAS